MLDYRDEWTTTRNAYEMGGATRASAWLERIVLRSAHAVTTATDEFRAELLARFDFLDPSRVYSIPNGYDPDDFPDPLPEPPADHFVLTYVGTVFRLTSARGLIEGIRRVHARDPELARLLDVRFIGRIVETETAFFDGTEALGVSRWGYIEHARAVAELAASHAALCILDDVVGVDRIYPAKIFEIMHLGLPCLALVPDGALARLVRHHGLGEVVDPRDPDAIATALGRMLGEFRDGRLGAARRSATPHVDIARFHRGRLAGEVASVFRSAIEQARRNRSESTRHTDRTALSRCAASPRPTPPT